MNDKGGTYSFYFLLDKMKNTFRVVNVLDIERIEDGRQDGIGKNTEENTVERIGNKEEEIRRNGLLRLLGSPKDQVVT